jgi:hypothetical protein
MLQSGYELPTVCMTHMANNTFTVWSSIKKTNIEKLCRNEPTGNTLDYAALCFTCKYGVGA